MFRVEKLAETVRGVCAHSCVLWNPVVVCGSFALQTICWAVLSPCEHEPEQEEHSRKQKRDVPIKIDAAIVDADAITDHTEDRKDQDQSGNTLHENAPFWVK